MALATLSDALDNLYTTTWQHMKGTAIDNIFDSTPFWFWMRDKGKIRNVSGGRHILEPLVYASNDDVGFIGRGGTVPINDYEFLTEAIFDWRYLVAPIVRFGVDDQKNRGPTRIMDLVTNKLGNAQESLITTLETTLFAAAGAEGGAFDGLQNLVADDPTAAVNVGSIPQNSNTWWRNQFKDMTGSSFATNGVSEMRTMRNNTQNNRAQDMPDILVSGQQPFEFYEDTALDKLEIQNTKLAEMGFDTQTFKGIPMVWSPSCAATRMYFLNSRFLNFVVDPFLNFDMTEWKPIPDQVNDKTAQIVLACTFTTSRRRVQGILFGIDTA